MDEGGTRRSSLRAREALRGLRRRLPQRPTGESQSTKLPFRIPRTTARTKDESLAAGDFRGETFFKSTALYCENLLDEAYTHSLSRIEEKSSQSVVRDPELLKACMKILDAAAATSGKLEPTLRATIKVLICALYDDCNSYDDERSYDEWYEAPFFEYAGKLHEQHYAVLQERDQLVEELEQQVRARIQKENKYVSLRNRITELGIAKLTLQKENSNLEERNKLLETQKISLEKDVQAANRKIEIVKRARQLTQLETQNKITAIRNQCKELQEELETLAEEKERAESALEKLKAEVGDDGKKREG